MFSKLITNKEIDYSFKFKRHIHIVNNYKPFTPFPILTEEAINILHEIIEENKDLIQSNDRFASFIRGLGYRSDFIRQLCYHPSMLQYLKQITGLTLIPHYLLSNVAHINIGLPNNKDVDKWHFDSVSYVLIILLSKPDSFEGGYLEYELDGEIQKVDFPSIGCGFFMKGSEVKHRVTKILEGKRISLINSYMDKNYPIDDTRLDTFFSDKNFEKEYFYGKKEWMNETSNLLK